MLCKLIDFSNKKAPNVVPFYFLLVGAPGFEPGTSYSRSMRATELRYAPLNPALRI